MKFFDPNERSLLALQGPKAVESLQRLTDFDLSKLYFMRSTLATVAGVETCRVTRCGYTGEDGFEISIPSIKADDVAGALLREDPIKLAGLGKILHFILLKFIFGLAFLNNNFILKN